MKNLTIVILLFLTFETSVSGQPCGVAQTLTSIQKSKISSLLGKLNIALQNEDLFHIDSLSNELKSVYSTQGGRPDAIEKYTTLVTNTNWVTTTDALFLSRKLIKADSMSYVELWKLAKGMNPPSYQPNSIFLRASAEIAAGLLKIADKETDLTRKAAYQLWATRALDSLATMQLANGAFPFPDLRTYSDPVFTPIIQKFILSCGADSVNVLKNGWIVDDKGSGEFKFDAGVIANAYFEAYQYTGDSKYKTIAIAIGDYLMPLKFNTNYNYNTFVSLGLSRAFQLTSTTTYMDRAIENLRYGVYPGQITTGRWVDGHNANSRYHSIIVQNSVPTVSLLPSNSTYKSDIETMSYLAVKNMVNYTNTCHSATGYRWLMKAYSLNSTILPGTLKNSITDLIGQYINQSVKVNNYLDVPTMGEYLELLTLTTGSIDKSAQSSFNGTIFPNPTNGMVTITFATTDVDLINISLYNSNGRLVKINEVAQTKNGNYNYQMDLSDEPPGIYLLTINNSNQVFTHKIILLE